MAKERNNIERRARDENNLRLYDSPTVTSSSDVNQEVPDTTVTSMVDIAQEVPDTIASLTQTSHSCCCWVTSWLALNLATTVPKVSSADGGQRWPGVAWSPGVTRHREVGLVRPQQCGPSLLQPGRPGEGGA